MSSVEIFESLRYHIENEMIIKIKRDNVDSDEFVGFPILLSDELLLMSKIVDFRNDGCIVFRVSDITDAYSTSDSDFYEKICKQEGLREKSLEGLCVSEVYNLKSVLSQLLDFNGFVSVGCEFEDNELYYSIGKLVRVERDILYLRHFGLDGQWEEEDREIEISKISFVSFNDSYSKFFYKYMA